MPCRLDVQCALLARDKPLSRTLRGALKLRLGSLICLTCKRTEIGHVGWLLDHWHWSQEWKYQPQDDSRLGAWVRVCSLLPYNTPESQVQFNIRLGPSLCCTLDPLGSCLSLTTLSASYRLLSLSLSPSLTADP